MELAAPTPAVLARAGALARAGEIVAFPTDTVYGVGTYAYNPAAVRNLYVVKGRPEDRPIPVLLDGPERLEAVARLVPPSARRVAERYWPGALTIVLPARELPREVTAGGETVGVRVPDHEVALAIIRAAGGIMAVTSANLSGHPNLTMGVEVAAALPRLALVVDGVAPGGVPSTVLDLAGPTPRVYRVGAIAVSELEATLGCRIEVAGRS